MDFRLFVESAPVIHGYHQTSEQAAKQILRRGFSLKNAPQPIIWFTNNLKDLLSGDTYSEGRGVILKVEVRLENPAGWKEYDNLLIAQFKGRGYDGAILPDSDGSFVGFVLRPDQIKATGVVGPDTEQV